MRVLGWAPVLVAALLAAQSASAQDGRRLRDPEATGSLAPVPRGPVFDRTTGQVCQRWCEWDNVPCDPPSFKIADGRCRSSRDGIW
ncbi:hypothetical protein [Methylobacterium oryzihabitans]|uniref:Uncharacterized protein n=1 Tax=Methylobacterium oryzihabitans TaxID=2499852 RepID=A0A3S2VUY8_9HYPH|nr:hypothetical protein [Methylobacterium oryzihabitans]RVU18166.1 hypothetical protein EOE48_12340 [Methylobacterium oryzihabitans]